MERAGLINQVKVKMDEFTPGGVGLPFDETIGPVLDECAREILKMAPLHLLTPTVIPLTGGTPVASIVKYSADKAYIPVPADYIRLYEVRYPLWKKSVRKAIAVEDPEYKIQENEYLKGGYGRPAVSVITTSIAGTMAKYFECSKVVDPGAIALTPVALYIKSVKPEALPDILADALTWLCASKVFVVQGYADKAKLVMEQFSLPS